MTNVKSTKRALLTSVTALFLCFAMLLGTTYAWFTDSVYSGNNNIIVGNLDIELEYLTEDGWKTVSNATDLFSDELWEPGHTEVVYLKLSNLGSLALKYQFSINIVSETSGTNVIGKEFNLSDYIYYDVIEGVDGLNMPYKTREDAKNAAEVSKKINDENNSMGGVMSAGNPELYLALVVFMPTWIGNEANYKTGTVAPEINLGINVVATQKAEEEDSFGSEYDYDATYTAEVDSLKTKLAAAKSGDIIDFDLTHDAYVTERITVPQGVTLNLNGNGYTMHMNTSDYALRSFRANLNIKNLNVVGCAKSAIQTFGERGYDENGKMVEYLAYTTMENVTVKLSKASISQVYFYGMGEATLTNCTIQGVTGDYNGTHIFVGAEMDVIVDGENSNIGKIYMNANENSTTSKFASSFTMKAGTVDELTLVSDGLENQAYNVEYNYVGGIVNEVIKVVETGAELESVLKDGYSAMLRKNITLAAHLSSSAMGDITIYGEGNTLSIRGIYGVGGKNVTLSNMTLVDNFEETPNSYTIYNQGGKVELTNVTYEGTTNWAFNFYGGGEVVLNDCDITGDVSEERYSHANIWCGDGRTLTVNGGTYGSIFMNASNAWELSAGKITLNDGTINKLILETEKDKAGTGYKSATLIQNGGTISELVRNPQGYDLSGLMMVVGTAADLESALESGYDVKLEKDIVLDETLKLAAGASGTLDLNGKTLKGDIIAPNANLTIKNGTIVDTTVKNSAIEINAGTLILEDVTITSDRHPIRIDGEVTAVINGGTYQASGEAQATVHAINVSGNANVTINGGTFKGIKGTTYGSAMGGSAVNVQSGANVIINGGNFSGGVNDTLHSDGTLKVYGGTFDQDPTAFVAQGYAAIDNKDGTYTVKPIDADIAKELIKAGGNVNLTGSTIDMCGETIKIPNGTTIVGGTIKNATLSVADDYTASFEGVEFGDTTTVQAEGDGSMSFVNCEFNINPKLISYRGAAIIGQSQYYTLDLYLDGCTFNYQYEEGDADLYNCAIFMWSNVDSCVIKNCTFNDYGFMSVKLMNVVEGAEIVFEGNTFNVSEQGDDNWWYNNAIQIVPQHDNAFTARFINNTFNGDFEDGKIVVWIDGMSNLTLTNHTIIHSGNKINDADVTDDNFAINP